MNAAAEPKREPTIFEVALACAERHGLPDVDIKAHSDPRDMRGHCTFCAGALDHPDDLHCDFCNETDV